MIYPTKEEVFNGEPYQILKWHRFLPSPTNEKEIEIINFLFDKYKEMNTKGEINSNTSKQVGW